MTAVVTALLLDEPARFNPGQLEQLCERIGEISAEAEVANALNRITIALDELHEVPRGWPDPALRPVIERVARDAHLIGMASLARVAGDVVQCIDTGDGVALAATLARLDRIGDRSVHAVWDFEDASC